MSPWIILAIVPGLTVGHPTAIPSFQSERGCATVAFYLTQQAQRHRRADLIFYCDRAAPEPAATYYPPQG
jgi:hypothetical protein